jgi:hypothetical protein
MTLEELELLGDEETTECIGRVYRYREKQYTTSDGGIHFHQSITPLKRKSCKGCGQCGWVDEELNSGQDMSFSTMDDFDLCTLSIVNSHQCYDGEWDYDLEFTKLEGGK